MNSFFDLYSVSLFIAAASIFFLRFRHEDPRLAPYMAISLGCAIANWLGEHGGGLAAISILAASSFLLLHLTSAPYNEDSSIDDRAKNLDG